MSGQLALDLDFGGVFRVGVLGLAGGGLPMFRRTLGTADTIEDAAKMSAAAKARAQPNDMQVLEVSRVDGGYLTPDEWVDYYAAQDALDLGAAGEDGR